MRVRRGDPFLFSFLLFFFEKGNTSDEIKHKHDEEMIAVGPQLV